MALTIADHHQILRGFKALGYTCIVAPTTEHNPILLRWQTPTEVIQFRLWVFDITHGGGGSAVRAADEFRIQITNGPDDLSEFDDAGVVDLLIGYSKARDSIVAYDRRWLENWSTKKATTGSGGSPSVQVKEADIQAGHDDGVHHITKRAAFGQANIVTMSPEFFPAFLKNYSKVLGGTMSAKDAAKNITSGGDVDNVYDYCRSQGFYFPPDLIARYLASILSKPFVILAGVSGTGKSKIVQLVAEFYSRGSGPGSTSKAKPATGDAFEFESTTGEPDRSRFCLVPVRPDWTDNHAVIGFVNPITEKYVSTPTLEIMFRAAAAPEKSHFMLLDEMNLARVEHYFSDWLSCTESRRLNSRGEISQESISLHRVEGELKTTVTTADGTVKAIDVPPNINVPTNLVVAGTVNVDETTYGISPKVLDRSMVIEFDDVNLDALRQVTKTGDLDGYRFPEKLPQFELATSKHYKSLPENAHEHLKSINGILEQARLHVGYRAANEIAAFMNVYSEVLPESDSDPDMLRSLDAAVLQKILPRIQGTRANLESPLIQLAGFLLDLKTDASADSDKSFDGDVDARLPHSYRRVVEMLATLREFGFVSFFK